MPGLDQVLDHQSRRVRRSPTVSLRHEADRSSAHGLSSHPSGAGPRVGELDVLPPGVGRSPGGWPAAVGAHRGGGGRPQSGPGSAQESEQELEGEGDNLFARPGAANAEDFRRRRWCVRHGWGMGRRFLAEDCPLPAWPAPGRPGGPGRGTEQH